MSSCQRQTEVTADTGGLNQLIYCGKNECYEEIVLFKITPKICKVQNGSAYFRLRGISDRKGKQHYDN